MGLRVEETQVTPSGRFIHHKANRCVSDVAGKKKQLFLLTLQTEKHNESLLPFFVFPNHAWTHTLIQSVPSSLCMAFFSGPQHAQEIGSVIVYVCGENATAVFFGRCQPAHFSLLS